MRKVCFWTIRDERPVFITKGLGRQLYRIRLWAQVERPDGFELLETDLQPRKPVRMDAIAKLAAGELCSMLVNETVIDAGFEVFIRGKQK